MAEYTKEPWRWQQLGDWMLVGGHGLVPIILNVDRRTKLLRVRSESGLMVPFDPDHPDMRRLVAYVNACKGIPTERLEQMTKDQSEPLARTLDAFRDDLIARLDE